MKSENIINEYEEVIKKIKDIVSAKIVTNENGQIEEIHVLANPNRNPKQLVRDIESTLMATYGSQTDHRKISIAQIDNHYELDKMSRLIFDRLESTVWGTLFEIKVVLKEKNGNEYHGTSKGVRSASNKLRLAACATLNAAEQYIKSPNIFNIEEVMVSDIANHDIVIVGVSKITTLGEEILPGVAVVKEDLNETIVMATLCAVDGVDW